MNEPDDRELEQYLKGDSPLSRRYRDASAESAPPELDEAILARARAELRRKPGSLNRYLAPLALAASVMLGVNLAWNVYQVQPVPSEVASAVDKVSRDRGFVPSPPPVAESVAPKSNVPAVPAAPAESVSAELRGEHKTRAPAAAPASEPARQEKFAADVERDDGMAESKREQEVLRKAEPQERMAMAQSSAAESQRREAQAPRAAGAVAPAMADAPAMPESAKIDALIRHVGGLRGAVFIRNGKEYGPAEAAQHLQYKREKAGDRVRTADDFIRLCASFSSMSGDAYLIRFADGRTRTAEDVLREELAQIEGR